MGKRNVGALHFFTVAAQAQRTLKVQDVKQQALF
jgi:hypothetical protein